jgi:hypothetical protein
MGRLETETISTKENLKHLKYLPGKWIDRALFQLAEVAVPRKLFTAILTNIGRLPWACDSG